MRTVHSLTLTAGLVAGLASLVTVGCDREAESAAECEVPCAEREEPVAVAAPLPPVERAVVTTSAIEDLQGSFKRAIAKTSPSVVSVYSSRTVSVRGGRNPLLGDPLLELFGLPDELPRELLQQGLGSGFIIDADGHVLTNSHVVEGADEIRVELADDRELVATLVGIDPPTDLAVLKIEAKGLQAVEIGDSDALEVGDFVLAIGNPFGLPQTISSGIVSAKGRADMGIVDFENFIQTDAAINPGSSGGPLVDLQGRVVGINTAIASRGGGNDGIAFAIPVNMAKGVIEQLRGEGRVVRGHLGVVISPLTPELARSFGFEGERGLLVQDVATGSAAQQAGLEGGDILTQLDGAPVTTVGAFRNAVARNRPGASLRLEIWRDGTARAIDVALGEAPAAGRRAEGPATTSKGEPPKLGLGLDDVTPRLRQQLSLGEDAKVVIAMVQPGSPAARAGLQPGDVLEQVGGTTVSSARQAIEQLREVDVDEGVRLRVSRRGTGRFVFLQAKSK